MKEDQQFLLNQKLKSLSRILITNFILHNRDQNKPDWVLVAFYLKSIDLFDGIIELHKINLDECAQALIRVLFETYIKYKHFLSIIDEHGEIEASRIVLESIMIMKEKDTEAQEKVSYEIGEVKILLGDIGVIKNKYNKDEISQIRKLGFSRLTIEQLSIKYNKSVEYNIMYRNFSRNVHANDMTEYIRKQGLVENSDYIDARNSNSFDFSFRLFFEIMICMNYKLLLNKVDKFDDIWTEYVNIVNS